MHASWKTFWVVQPYPAFEFSTCQGGWKGQDKEPETAAQGRKIYLGSQGVQVLDSLAHGEDDATQGADERVQQVEDLLCGPSIFWHTALDAQKLDQGHQSDQAIPNGKPNEGELLPVWILVDLLPPWRQIMKIIGCRHDGFSLSSHAVGTYNRKFFHDQSWRCHHAHARVIFGEAMASCATMLSQSNAHPEC